MSSKQSGCHILKDPFEDQKPAITLFGVMERIVFSKKRVVTTKMKKELPCWKNFFTNHNPLHRTSAKKAKINPNMA